MHMLIFTGFVESNANDGLLTSPSPTYLQPLSQQGEKEYSNRCVFLMQDTVWKEQELQFIKKMIVTIFDGLSGSVISLQLPSPIQEKLYLRINQNI